MSLGAIAFINGIIGVAVPWLDWINGKVILPNNYSFGMRDCFAFGTSNLIVSAVLFFIISNIIRWKSKNNPKTPFIKGSEL